MTTKILAGVLSAILMVLCGLSVLQWQREAKLRDTIKALDTELKTEQQKNLDLELKLTAWEKEIRQLNERITEQTTKIQEQEVKLASFTNDEANQKVRADQLEKELEVATASLEQTKTSLKEWQDKAVALNESLMTQNENIKKLNEAVAEQNEAIKKQNELLKTVTEERDGTITKLNDQIAKYNELMEKYNKAIKSSN